MRDTREEKLRPIHLSFASAVVAGTATIFVSGLVLVDAAYNSPSLHVSLETAAVILVAVIAASVCLTSFGTPPSGSPRFSPGTWSFEAIGQHPELILQSLVSA